MNGDSSYRDGVNGGAGPLAEEAAKLIGAAQDWLHRTLGDPATARLANGSQECCWCPVCQLIATLRGDRREVSDRLAEAQAAVAGLLHALADAAGTAGATAGQRAGSPRVHRIRLDDEPNSGDGAGSAADARPDGG